MSELTLTWALPCAPFAGLDAVRLEARTAGGVQSIVLDRDGVKVNGVRVGGPAG